MDIQSRLASPALRSALSLNVRCFTPGVAIGAFLELSMTDNRTEVRLFGPRTLYVSPNTSLNSSSHSPHQPCTLPRALVRPPTSAAHAPLPTPRSPTWSTHTGYSRSLSGPGSLRTQNTRMGLSSREVCRDDIHYRIMSNVYALCAGYAFTANYFSH